MHTDLDKPAQGWRRTLYTVIYESDTPAGRRFDQILIWTILISVLAVILDSVASIADTHGPLLHVLEWGFTLVFTVEYVLRLACTERPRKYALSFFGIIDLLSILPSYLALFEPGALFFLDARHPAPLQELDGYLESFAPTLRSTTCLLVVTHIDQATHDFSTQRFAQHVRERGYAMPVIEIDPRQRRDVLYALNLLLEVLDAPTAGAANAA